MPKKRRKLLRDVSRRHFNRLVKKSCSEANSYLNLDSNQVSCTSRHPTPSSECRDLSQCQISSVHEPTPGCSSQVALWSSRPKSQISFGHETTPGCSSQVTLDRPRLDATCSSLSHDSTPTCRPRTHSSDESYSSIRTSPRSRTDSESTGSSDEESRPINTNEVVTDVLPVEDRFNYQSIDDHRPTQQAVDGSNIKSSLANWALKYQDTIQHNSLNDLLGILRNHACFACLPKDSRTLLQTPRAVVIEDMPPGMYHHFGLRAGIINLFKSMNSDLNCHSLKLLVGIDGLPISVSSKSELWPILCHAVTFPESTIFPIGIYHGKSKPADANLFLKQFVEEAVDLCTNGLEIRGKIMQIRIWGIICDAPAKSYISQTKGHTAFYSCSKCCVEGYYTDNRVCFPDMDSPKRTHEDFVSHRQEEHHNGHSSLEMLPYFDMIKNIPLDYMHLICLGVVRKLLRDIWIHGKVPFKLPFRKVEEASEVLISLKSHIPMEFARKPRELQEISRWKATELRQILLYTGPVVFATVLSPDKYLHFMTLHVAVRIFASKEFCSNNQLHFYANSLLTHFVETFSILYDIKFVSHNVHALLHIADDVKEYGPLDTYSAFRFENYMQPLKKLLRKAEAPLSQLARRFYEKQANNTTTAGQKTKQEFGGLHDNGPLILGCTAPQFSVWNKSNFTVNLKEPNNCVGFLDGSIAMINNFCYSSEHKDIVCVGRKFLKKSNLYEKPCESSLLHTYKVSRLLETLQCWPVQEIRNKFVKLPLNCGVNEVCYAVFPILHAD